MNWIWIGVDRNGAQVYFNAEQQAFGFDPDDKRRDVPTLNVELVECNGVEDAIAILCDSCVSLG